MQTVYLSAFKDTVCRKAWTNMYQADNFYQADEETFVLTLPVHKDFKILQLTDLHLGFGFLSGRKDALALQAVTAIIKKAEPDLIVFTGDTVFPFLPKTGTMNNRKEAKKFIAFIDSFRIPYALVMGNHDTEMGSKCGREELADIFAKGSYSIMAKGPKDIFGVGNYFIHIKTEDDVTRLALCMLDCGMYGDGWFFSGFDCIHEDQADWCMTHLKGLKAKNPEVTALAFFHMPPAEFKEAYEKMKLGDKSVTYHLGSIGEKNDYFGISKNISSFFEKAVENGVIKGMFCGHDHLNTLSLTYQGIRLTYGMSIDYLGYAGIGKQYTQRGGTLITRRVNGETTVELVPLDRVVSKRVRGKKSPIY